MQCKYVRQNGSRCQREALSNSEKGYCILHEDWVHKNEEEVKKEFYKEIEEGMTDFEGCILPEIDLSKKTIEGSIQFARATIEGSASFEGATIKGYPWFEEVTIKGYASFEGATIEGDAWFGGATIKGYVSFNGATIKGGISFDGKATIEGNVLFEEAIIGGASFDTATIKGNTRFEGATIERDVSFKEATLEAGASFGGATIKGYASFEGATIESASFEGATINRYASFNGATIEVYVSFPLSNISSLTFKNAKFNYMSVQEDACREAKITQERRGDRELTDYHFYREMEAKRKRKYKTFSLEPILKLIRKLRLEKLIDKHKEFFEKERRIYRGFLELPVQYIFGYGVHPWRVITTWLATVFCLAFVYWLGHGVVAADSFWECLYFSIVTAATPGYGGYTPAPGLYQGLASFEAIFGTFMWAAFIATFARKYMR